MLKTHIRCSCGKEFINSSELGHAFALANHTVKQLFYALAAQLHFLVHGHKKLAVYETYESSKEEGEKKCDL